MSARSRVKVDGVTPFLWFDDDAADAARLYTSLIAGSRVTGTYRPAADGGKRPGPVLVVNFELAGRPFIALNGGPGHPPTDAFSIHVTCPGQREVDRLWTALTRGGREVACGWLKDRYGVSWQIIPRRMTELFGSPDREAAGRALAAMMKMKKIDLAKLQAAFRGAPTPSAGRRRRR